MRGMIRWILVGAALGAGAGCTRIQNNQGYIVDQELVAAVQPGVDNKQSVQKALGRPTLASQWDDNVWYYISRNTKQIAFARPRAASQNVLIVHFTSDGTVEKVEKRGLELAQNITPNKDKTPTLGRDESLWEDLFGNIGQVGSMPGAGGGGGPQ